MGWVPGRMVDPGEMNTASGPGGRPRAAPFPHLLLLCELAQATRHSGAQIGIPAPTAAQRMGSLQAVSRSFNPPDGVLFTVPSRYFCAIRFLV